MGEIVNLNDYREKKRAEKEEQKPSREHRIDEIMGWLEEFFVNNPVDLNPYYISLQDDTIWASDKTDTYFDYKPTTIEIEKDDPEE
tara:strand:- start:1 stop:258 length:258 start_codon:yes stop_codon:yes gene_type:complete